MSTEVLTPSGPLSVELTRLGQCAALLTTLWRSATSFALTRMGRARVDHSDLLVPTQELARLVADVGPVRDRMLRGKWVREWPGTRRRGSGTLWLECRAGGQPPFALDEALLWRGVGRLDDFQLFDAKGLRLFVCSHEGFGRLFGTAAELKGLELARRPWGELRVTGENLDARVLQHLQTLRAQ